MDPKDNDSPYREPLLCVVGKASDLMKNSINGYLYDAGGSYYVPYQ